MLTAGRLRRGDDGFTLVELLVAIVILGILAVPMADVVVAYLKNSDATSARLSESHDAQIAAAYFARDVQALGVHDYTVAGTATYPLKQSVETDVAAGGGTYACGAAGTPNAVVRLAWDDFPSGPGTPVHIVVAYVVENGTELHRLRCEGSPAVVSDVRVAEHLVAPFATVTCADQAGAATACTGSGSAVPSTVSMVLSIHDPAVAAGSTYTVPLIGQRRQS
jgi:prepilin-type N-terminal cleavage/methylation domain-containing protein